VNAPANTAPGETAADAFPRAERADIGLLLEGTFPYVAGGVSSWVNQIIRGFPDLSFAVIFIGSRREDYGDMKYALPPNVVHLETHYLFERPRVPLVRPLPADPEISEQVGRLHDYFRAPHSHAADAGLFKQLVPELCPGGRLDHDRFLFSKSSWDYIRDSYRRFCTDPSFIDYFWTVRTMHAPVWTLAEIAESFIPVRAYHTVSTGYAGLLGTLLKQRRGRPLILSEHGIYTKERKIDLFQADWVKDNRNVFQKDPTEIGYFRRMWIRFFEALGRMCYDSSDQITSLYEANRLRQITDGADAARTRNVPNGVNVARFAPLRTQRPTEIPPVLCLIGRVVPIKDIKTFVRAMRIVANRLPQAEGWIAGPEDEDPEYARECRELAANLGIADKVKFLGFQQMTELLPKVGVGVLSSISEALPLVVLEGYAAGVPAVCTDVGSCRQLVYGLPGEDEALGASGRIVRIADPDGLATAAIELLTQPDEWRAASAAGIARVERYYTQELMFGAYREIYDDALKVGA
jgi:glycosyltransferase involved in cell wall biosynthesis